MPLHGAYDLGITSAMDTNLKLQALVVEFKDWSNQLSRLAHLSGLMQDGKTKMMDHLQHHKEMVTWMETLVSLMKRLHLGILQEINNSAADKDKVVNSSVPCVAEPK